MSSPSATFSASTLGVGPFPGDIASAPSGVSGGAVLALLPRRPGPGR
ncbi:hypothetical protein EI555_015105 [Monodon monoceros]|uniref:Uncharacterized protein n=1 Tax=Monodon monoceros TaxID=40151 RepID=A0A4U1EZ75_MONMO|nr:hypothetical protein EI555_015105 [Monodon monoceros]